MEEPLPPPAVPLFSDEDVREMESVIQTPFWKAGEDFRVVMDELVYLIGEYGLRSVRPHSERPFRPLGRRRSRVFVKQVHEGWKIAQSRILALIHELGDEKARHEEDAKQAHRERAPDLKRAATSEANRCGWQIWILRRFLDSICWSMLDGQHHVIRRLHQDKVPKPPTRAEVAHIWDEVTHVNARRMQIAIVADATTFIGTCDLLVRHYRKNQTFFVELKSGEKGIAMASAARFAVTSGCPEFERLATDGMGPTDRKHFARAKRQVERLVSIEEIIKTGKGTDHRTGGQIHTPEMPVPPAHFGPRLARMLEGINEEKGWGLDVIDNCLYLGAYREARMMVAFFGWIRGEGLKGPIYNLLESYRSPLTRPLTSSFLSPGIVRRLLRCDLNVAVFLDVEAWITESNKLPGIHMFLETDAKSKKHHQEHPHHEMATHEGRLIGIEYAGNISYLGQGALDRILFDFQTPLSVTMTSLAGVVGATETVPEETV